MLSDKYRGFRKDDIKKLSKLCREVTTDRNILNDFSHDELGHGRKPDVVVFPKSTEEVISILRYASDTSLPVTPRGTGTGLCGGAVPIYGGISICLSKMDKICEIDEENATMTVEAGVLLMSVHEAAERIGYLYGPDPGEKTATIGGNISTNAGGMRAVKYGVTRDSILGLEMVLPNGEVLLLGGKQAKNSTGYSLLNLVIGSEGTLGVVTKAILKLFPLPKSTSSLLVPFPSLGEATLAVPRILSCGILPQSIEFAERNVILAAEKYIGKKFPHTTAPAYLMIRLEAASDADLEIQMQLAAEACLSSCADDVLIASSKEQEKTIWDCRADFLAAVKSGSEVDECDVVVPRNRIAEFVEYSKKVSSEVDIRIDSFGHAADGNLHIYILRDDKPQDEWREKLVRAMDLLYSKGHILGGLVSGEHGIGFAKKQYMKRTLSTNELNFMSDIKRSFDPKGIMNPGKVIDVL